MTSVMVTLPPWPLARALLEKDLATDSGERNVMAALALAAGTRPSSLLNWVLRSMLLLAEAENAPLVVLATTSTFSVQLPFAATVPALALTENAPATGLKAGAVPAGQDALALGVGATRSAGVPPSSGNTSVMPKPGSAIGLLLVTVSVSVTGAPPSTAVPLPKDLAIVGRLTPRTPMLCVTAPALATAAISSALPTAVMPPHEIGWSTPNISVNVVRIMPAPALETSPTELNDRLVSNHAGRLVSVSRIGMEPGPPDGGQRQIGVLERGGTIVQETRDYDGQTGVSQSLRSKEMAHDYRYFPEPDLQPLKVSAEFIEQIKAELPELPDAMRDRFMSEYELSFNDASQIVLDKSLAEFYETTAKVSGNPRTSANFILSELLRELNHSNKTAADSPVSAENLAELIKTLDAGKINNNQAKEVLVEMFASGKTSGEVIKEKGFEQISDSSAIEKIVDEIIENNENQVNAYRGGNEKLFGFFVGQVMKASQGKANPKIVNEILKNKL